MREFVPQVLTGRHVRLEPLSPAHEPGLRAIDDASLYRFLPEYPQQFDAWFRAALASPDPLFFAAVARTRAEGRLAALRIDTEHGVAEIGHILWGPGLRRTAASTEALFLLVDHLFRLGARRVEWKCDNRNEASRSAALRFGFTFEGVFRQHRIVKGENRDTAWFSLLDHEWASRRSALDEWLDPCNFDAEGRQRRPLRECSG